MIEYGLIGYPLDHSFSQKYFTDKFATESLKDHFFRLFPLKHISELPDVISSHRDLRGLSVTIPYKRSVIAFLDDIHPTAAALQAVNSIRIHDNKLTGYNTDVAGFKKSFVKSLLPHHKRALILGTGGSASAVKYVLEKLSITYQVVSRIPDRAAGQIGYNDLDDKTISSHQVIINCTPAGMYPSVTVAPDVPYHLITDQHYLFDLVYNPAETLFLKEGKKRGATIQNGEEMLYLQAEESWKIWNGIK